MWSPFGLKAGFIPSAVGFAYKGAMKVVAAGFAAVLGVVTIDDIWANRIVIEPLSVPHKLEDEGYTGAIVSQRLLREVQVIVGSAQTLLREPTGDGGAAQRITFSNESALANLATIQLPASGLSIHSVSSILRDVFDWPERKITGEITINRPAGATEPVYSIALRLPSGECVPVEHSNINHAISLSAQSIAQQFNPLALAAYFYQQERKSSWDEEKGLINEKRRAELEKQKRNNWEKVDRIADNLIEGAGSKLRKEGLFLRAIVLRELKQPDDAIHYFQQATKANDQFSDAYNGWAAVLADENRISEALAIYERAIRANQKNPETYRNRALIYKRNGEFERAIADFNSAIHLGLKDVDVFFQLGITYEAVRNFADAVKVYDLALKLQPRHEWALNNRCYSKAMLEDVSAIVDCNAALRLRDDPAFYDGRGFAHLKLGQLEKAIEDYSKALSHYPAGSKLPDQAYSLYGRGVARRMKGDIDAGNADIAAAKRLKRGVEDEMSKLNVTPCSLCTAEANPRRIVP
jgi:tetratricopeptide (TPR) repeat protein